MSSKTIDEQMNESQIILDVIDAIKTDRPVRFDYGADIVREIKPVGFFGDYAGFEGVEAERQYRV